MSAHTGKHRHRRAHGGKRRGCFFYGCSSIVVLVLACTAILVFLVYLLLSRKQMEMPPVAVESGEYEDIKARVESFAQALDQGRPAILRLTAKDLNVLVQFDPRLAEYKDRVRILIEDGKLAGYVSFPADMFQTLLKWASRSMFLNAKATFSIGTLRGTPYAHLAALEIKGKPLPTVVLRGIQAENLLEPLLRRPEVQVRAMKVTAIRVEDDAVVLESATKRQQPLVDAPREGPLGG